MQAVFMVSNSKMHSEGWRGEAEEWAKLMNTVLMIKLHLQETRLLKRLCETHSKLANQRVRKSRYLSTNPHFPLFEGHSWRVKFLVILIWPFPNSTEVTWPDSTSRKYNQKSCSWLTWNVCMWSAVCA
jgi:hypothetical protein